VDRLAISTVLERAADYIDAHGLRSGGFGRPGQPVCLNGAIAIGLGFDPIRVGWGPLFRPGTCDEALRIAEVVLASGLLDMLPPPAAESWERRRDRPTGLRGRQALVEVARWTDAPGRTTEQAVRALRRAAARLNLGARPAALSLAAA
jgi:hypothetical protein